MDILHDNVISHFTSDYFSGKHPAHAVVTELWGKDKCSSSSCLKGCRTSSQLSWRCLHCLGNCLACASLLCLDLLAHILIIGRYLRASGSMFSFCLRASTKGFYQVVICRYCKIRGLLKMQRENTLTLKIWIQIKNNEFSVKLDGNR